MVDERQTERLHYHADRANPIPRGRGPMPWRAMPMRSFTRERHD
jgi:hypothetical protein